MSFKINAKQFFLTYPKCTLTKEVLLEALEAVKEISKYTISLEAHQDGTPHLHAVIAFSSKVHSTNPRVFDIMGFHCNIKNLKSKKDFVDTTAYIKKHKDFITNLTEVLSKRASLAKNILEEGKITKKLITENPEIIFLNFSSVSSWLQTFKKPIDVPPPPVKRRHIFLSGPSNTGKTTWFRVYKTLFDKVSEIPDNNDFKGIDEETTLVFSDEFRGNITVQQLNKICDGDTQLNTKGGSTRIAYPTVVLISNYSLRECYPKISDMLYETLCNRFVQYDSLFNLPKFPQSIINL